MVALCDNHLFRQLLALLWLVGISMMLGCEPAKQEPAPIAAPAIAPENTDLLQRAKDRSARGDTLGAIDAYSQVLQKDPSQLAALGNRALLLAAQGRNEEAIADYDQLLLIDAQNYPAIDRRAALRDRMGQYQLALDDLQLILSHRDNDPALYNRICEAQLHLGHYQPALQAIEQALRLKRGWPIALRNRAAVYDAMGDYDRAEQDYQSLLQRDPQDSEALNGMGLIAQFRSGDLVAAETYYRKAVLFNPYNAGAWYNIAFLEAQQDLLDAAIKDFGEAIRCDSRYADAYVNRGLLWMRKEAVTTALADFETALGLQPANMHTKLLRGWARCEAGQRTPGCLDLADARAAHEPGVESLIATYCK
jgi:tetratricopeptide (TPR) repeat protein